MNRQQTSESSRAAAQWVVQLRAPDRPADCEQAFADWLRASPLHVRDYLRAVEVWEGLGHPGLASHLTRDALVREAGETNLVMLPGTQPPTAAARMRFGLPGLALPCLAMALGILAYASWPQPLIADVVTGVGEQRSSVLPDHSIVELNTRSEVRVTFTSNERRVELVRGEAFFDVSKDPGRPFVVYTDVATAKAVGTRFSVYRSLSGTIVTVAEGRVLVRHQRPASQSAEAVEVVPGTQAEARPDRPVQMHAANIERTLAWRERRLVFDGTPLEEVVREFNRYNSPSLTITDPGLNGQRISGVFGANDPESLLDFLVKMDHVNIQRVGSETIRIGSRAPQQAP